MKTAPVLYIAFACLCGLTIVVCRTQADSALVGENLHQGLVVLKDYYESRLSWPKHTPWKGKRLSWRISCLPFLYSRDPCDCAKYLPDFRGVPEGSKVMDCLFALSPVQFCTGGSGRTHMITVVGEGSPITEGTSLFDLPNDCILLVALPDRSVHWLAEATVDCQSMKTQPAGGVLGDFLQAGIYVAFADGNVWHLSKDTPSRLIQQFFTVKGAKLNDRDKVLGKWRVGT